MGRILMAGGFLRDTKEILSTAPAKARRQRLAELHALLAGIGQVLIGENGAISLLLQSENLPAVRRGDFLIRVLTQEEPEVASFLGARGKNPLYSVGLSNSRATAGLLQDMGFLNSKGALRDMELPAPGSLIQEDASRRAFLRGAFLAAGYISNPENEYHWEVGVLSRGRGEELVSLLKSWNLPAKLSQRKGRYVVYMKESEAISTTLSLMGAYQSTLQWESARAFRSLQGHVNRQVNCETANLAKSSQAGEEQIKAIRRLEAEKGLDSLPRSLREVALLRLENPEASLKELGEMLSPPVGKSGMNHRFRKIIEIAEKL